MGDGGTGGRGDGRLLKGLDVEGVVEDRIGVRCVLERPSDLSNWRIQFGSNRLLVEVVAKSTREREGRTKCKHRVWYFVVLYMDTLQHTRE